MMKIQRIGLVISFASFIALNALAPSMTQANTAPGEIAPGKVDETPLLDKTPTAPAVDTAPIASAGSNSSTPSKTAEPELKNTINSLREKLTEMEARVEELTRKLEAKAPVKTPPQASTKISAKAATPGSAPSTAPASVHATATGAELDSIPGEESATAPASSKKIETVSVPMHPGDRIGTSVSVKDVPGDPELGFTNDSTIQEFRSAIILHKAGKYPEAVLAFSTFVENYPDHPLAGTAQFYVGNSYYKQKEYGLAVREYQRVLTTYDRSTHIAQTLREISDAEDALRKSDDAARHRQLLMSLFPHSPFATKPAVSKAAPAPAPASSAQPAGPENKDIQ